MYENATNLRERLEAEGGLERWEAFKARKEDLLAQGLSAKQAWEQAKAEFPAIGTEHQLENLPSPMPDSQDDDKTVTLLVSAAAGRVASELAEIRWVFQNIVMRWEDIDSEAVPSPGAVGLLVYARQPANRRDFYQIWTKTLPRRSDTILDRDSLYDDLKRFDELDAQYAKQDGCP